MLARLRSVWAITFGTRSSRSRISSLPSASEVRFALRASTEIACRRCSGSAISVCTGISVMPTWLPRSPPLFWPRRDSGTPAIMVASGNSPLLARYWRNAPPTIARNRSFTVASPTRWRILRKSASGRLTASNTRCEETLPLKRVSGDSSGLSAPRSPASTRRSFDCSGTPSSRIFTIASLPRPATRRAVVSANRARAGTFSALWTSARE